MLWNLLETVKMEIEHYTMEGSGRLLEESQYEKNLVFECNESKLALWLCPPKHELVLKPFWLFSWLGGTFWPTVTGYVFQGVKLQNFVDSLLKLFRPCSQWHDEVELLRFLLCHATSQSTGPVRAAACTVQAFDQGQLHVGTVWGPPSLEGSCAVLLLSWTIFIIVTKGPTFSFRTCRLWNSSC